ncbi:hypothetical protein C5Y93_22195 [Blastopirellula marina]|uniref:Glycosyltransferase 2-like domain-containing protein n=2 Tax=Blastopirellula marina TaxID=124 RepID=A0A2S8GHG0_9BACT|nr:hypothetical protein C5Y93_22195 [Blastopirellula marina]
MISMSKSEANPLVSVIVPAYNAGEFLQASIESVLAQTHRNLEVLVVDDGSTDGAVDAAKEQLKDDRIVWHRQENSGKSVALNFALERIRGEFYLLQDADDISSPDRVERLVSAALESPEVAAVFSGYDLILRGRRVAPILRDKSIAQCERDIDAFAMPSLDPTGMYRVSAIREMRYNESLRIGQGFDYILRVGERYPMRMLGECLYSYRVEWGSATRFNPEKRHKMVCEVLRLACERRGLSFDELFAQSSFLQSKPTPDNGIANHFMASVQDLRDRNEVLSALRASIQCLLLNPFVPRFAKPIVCACSPNWFRRRLKSFNG